jgi:hypothetical protein
VSVFKRIEGQVAFVFYRVVAAIIGNERMRKFMQAKGEYPADDNNEEGHF